MGMTENNLCNSCTNIGCMFQSGIVRTECAFYMPPHIEPDTCGNYVVMQSADMYDKDTVLWMFRELQLEIEELKNEPHCCEHYVRGINNSSNVIQKKIDSLKGGSDGDK